PFPRSCTSPLSQSPPLHPPFSPLPRRARTPPRQLEVRAAPPYAFSFLYDLHPFPVSELQGAELDDKKVDPAFSYHQSHLHFDCHELRMDAGGVVPCLSTLRISPALAVARMATRNRRRDWRRMNRDCRVVIA